MNIFQRIKEWWQEPTEIEKLVTQLDRIEEMRHKNRWIVRRHSSTIVLGKVGEEKTLYDSTTH